MENKILILNFLPYLFKSVDDSIEKSLLIWILYALHKNILNLLNLDT